MNAILLFFCITLFLLAWCIFEGDFLCPAILCTAAFCISVGTALAAAPLWDFEISNQGMILIITSLLAYILGSAFAYIICKPRNVKPVISDTTIAVSIPSANKAVLVFLLGLPVMYLYYRSVVSIAGLGTSADFQSVLHQFRIVTSFQNSDSIPAYLQILRQCVSAGAFYFVFCFVHSLVRSGISKNMLYYLLPVIPFAGITIINATRTDLIYLVFSAFFSYVFLSRRYKGTKVFGLKSIIKIIIAFVVGVFIFIMMGYLVGRSMTYSPLYLVYVYAGSPIVNLDYFLETFSRCTSIWGQETFSGIINFFGPRLGFLDASYSTQLPFHMIGSMSLGNLYSSLRYYYSDFGFLGCLICCYLQGLLLSFFYFKVKYSKRFIPSGTLALSVVLVSAPYMPLLDLLFHAFCSVYSGFFVFLLLIIGLRFFKEPSNNYRGSSKSHLADTKLVEDIEIWA